MSLIRLLTAGKSLVGLRDIESRYRVRPRNRLPRFGSSRNPFIAKTATPNLPLPASAQAPVRSNPAEKTPAEVAAAALKQTTPLPAASTQIPGTKKSGDPATKSNLLSRLASRVRSFNPFAGRPGFRRAATSAATKATATPVQGELSLDRIKVVRNDLSDADVEIVPAKPVVKPKPASVTVPGKAAELAPAGPR